MGHCLKTKVSLELVAEQGQNWTWVRHGSRGGGRGWHPPKLVLNFVKFMQNLVNFSDFRGYHSPKIQGLDPNLVRSLNTPIFNMGLA